MAQKNKPGTLNPQMPILSRFEKAKGMLKKSMSSKLHEAKYFKPEAAAAKAKGATMAQKNKPGTLNPQIPILNQSENQKGLLKKSAPGFKDGP